MGFKNKITIFTPTYNRAYILGNLYHSIQRQTFRDFEWLIIDDGSSDNTEKLIREWIKDDNDFLIRYYKVNNGGKCRAINKGLDLAHGELFFVMDSDDYLTDDALERINYWESTIHNKPMYMGVAGNCGTSKTDSPNRTLTEAFRDCSAFHRYPEYTRDVIDGERAGVWYTEVHRKYKYPEFENENFMTEAVAWNRMANDGYKVRVFDEIIWIYDYRNDGLTKAGDSLFVKNPRGTGLFFREKAEFMHYSFFDRMKMWYSFYCEMSFCDKPYRLTKKQCAEYIGAPICVMYVSAAMHQITRIRKNKRIKK